MVAELAGRGLCPETESGRSISMKGVVWGAVPDRGVPDRRGQAAIPAQSGACGPGSDTKSVLLREHPVAASEALSQERSPVLLCSRPRSGCSSQKATPLSHCRLWTTVRAPAGW